MTTSAGESSEGIGRGRGFGSRPWLMGVLLVLGGCYSGPPRSSGPVTPSPVPVATPTPTPPVDPIVDLTSRAEHTCALRQSGTVLCWGRNDQGQVGDGTGVSTFTPTIVTFPPGTAAVTSVVAAADQTCAIVAPGDVWCWGGNSNGELLLPGDKMGNDAFALSPREIDLDFDVAQLATGVTHTCALSTTGQVLCWGVNGDGQIGDGTTADALDPTPVQLGCP